jgi:hypothetical protein
MLEINPIDFLSIICCYTSLLALIVAISLYNLVLKSPLKFVVIFISNLIS